MAEGIPGRIYGFRIKQTKGADAARLSNIMFSYKGITNHNLFMPNRGIQKSFSVSSRIQKALHESLVSINNITVGAVVSYKDQGSALYFNVAEIDGSNAKLQLNYIQHEARSKMSVRWAETMKELSGRFNKAGLKVGIKMGNEATWRQIDIGTALTFTELAIDTGNTYRIKVTGGGVGDRQKALLDLWLAIKAEEDLDMEMEFAKKFKAGEINPPPIYEPNFREILPQDKFSGLVLDCPLSHLDASKTESYHGRLVIWDFYKTFEKARGALTPDVSIEKINDIFKYLIVNYGKRSADKTNEIKDAAVNYGKRSADKTIEIKDAAVEIFADMQRTLMGEIGDKSEVSVEFLERFFAKIINMFHGRNKENIEMVVNYFVKGIIGEEDMENAIPNSYEPIILCTPSLTMAEAMNLPANVVCVLASDMREDSHPYQILNGKDITTFAVTGKIAEFINSGSEKFANNYQPVSVVVGGRTLWLDVGLPENLHRENMRAQAYFKTEETRSLAFNGLERRIIDGSEILLQAMVRGDINLLKEEFKLRAPDGIGLFTTETSHIRKKALLTEKEMVEEVNELCEISKRITIRLEDESPMKITPEKGTGDAATDTGETASIQEEGESRRDNKRMPGIENQGNLSGAAFLLSEEGQKKLLRPRFEATLTAYLKKKPEGNDIKIMVPFVTDSGQLERIRGVLQECKEQILAEHGKTGKTSRELDLMRDSLRIPLGAMMETKEIFTEGAKEGAYNCENIARRSDFGSIGLNDLRFSFKKTTILDPEIVKAISEAVRQFSALSKHLSVCGRIYSNKEFLLLNVLGIRDFSVYLNQIQGFSEAVRLLKQEELDSLKEKILKASTSEEIEKILDEGQKHIIERLRNQAINAATTGNDLRKKAEEARLGSIRETKIKVMDTIFHIIRDDKSDKEQRILKVMADELNNKELKDELLEMPKLEDITKWLADEMLVISFLDEWVIRIAMGVKCRCTPYVFCRSDDGELWARAIPRGGDTGSKSRYYIENMAKIEVESVKNGKEKLVIVNYFSGKQKEIAQTTSFAKPLNDAGDRFEVKIKEAGEPEETIQFLLKKENGQDVYYRKLTAEKLFAAKVLDGDIPMPHDPSIHKEQYLNVNALFISDRIGLSKRKSIPVEDLKTSIDRDRKNMYYQPKDPEKRTAYNINQSLILKMRSLNGNQSYVIIVDNWLENKKGEFQPLLDTARLAKVVKFLGIEMEADEMILNHIKEIKILKEEINIQKKQMEDLSAKINNKKSK